MVRTIEISDDSDPNDGWSMINATTEDVAAADTAMADNPTDNTVANQNDILTAAAAEPSAESNEAGSVMP